MARMTRRGMLASLGIGGVGVVGLAQGGDQAYYTNYTYAQSNGDEEVEVAWYETYNGQFLEHQGGTSTATANETLDAEQDPAYVPEVSGPVISLGNVLPGDSGHLAIGLSLTEEPDGSGPLSIDLTGRLQENAENGRTEPERSAGDTSGSTGELADAVQAEIWDDVGPMPCDGRPLLDPVIASGSLRDVLSALDGTRLCTGCLELQSTRCLGFSWSLPDDTSNRVQGDSVVFDLVVEAHDRGGDS